MIATRSWIAAGMAVVLTLALPAAAGANELADACAGYTRSSEMLKQVPAANKARWCDCIVDKVPRGEQRSAAAVIKLQQDAEAKGQALGEHNVPAAHAKAFKQYFDAQGACLPVMMGAGPPTGGPPAGGAAAGSRSGTSAAAPPASAPSTHNADFNLVNRTGYAIAELYVSPTRSKSWGKDMLGDHTIENGETWKITFPQSRNQCRQDIKIVFADSADAVWEDFNLCELSKITLTYNRRTGVTTAETE